MIFPRRTVTLIGLVLIGLVIAAHAVSTSEKVSDVGQLSVVEIEEQLQVGFTCSVSYTICLSVTLLALSPCRGSKCP